MGRPRVEMTPGEDSRAEARMGDRLRVTEVYGVGRSSKEKLNREEVRLVIKR